MTRATLDFRNSNTPRILRLGFRASKGFTLIEMIVAIAIFMIVAVIAVGSLVRVVALNRQAQTLQASVSNLSFSLDSLSREIRQGSKIGCYTGLYQGGTFTPSTVTGSCTSMSANANNLIVFQTGKTDQSRSCNLYYAYWFKPAGSSYILEKAQQPNCGQTTLSDNNGNGDFYPIVDTANVTLTGYNLAVFSSRPSFLYKWIFIRLKGFSGVRDQDQNSFDVETSISQRVND